jgi:hypothetical protein
MRVPLAAPAAVGEKVVLMVQEPPAGIVVQVFVCLNGPVVLTDDTDTAVLPGLATVTVCAPRVDLQRDG